MNRNFFYFVYFLIIYWEYVPKFSHKLYRENILTAPPLINFIEMAEQNAAVERFSTYNFSFNLLSLFNLSITYISILCLINFLDS